MTIDINARYTNQKEFDATIGVALTALAQGKYVQIKGGQLTILDKKAQEGFLGLFSNKSDTQSTEVTPAIIAALTKNIDYLGPYEKELRALEERWEKRNQGAGLNICQLLAQVVNRKEEAAARQEVVKVEYEQPLPKNSGYRLMQNDTTDVKLVASDKSEVRAHSSVLKRAKLLKTMFEIDQDVHELPVPQLSARDIRDTLDFLYTGTIQKI
ncbi:MAG: BTB/POZ domain-containing protein [Parachlamydiaceae bacterium]|nr:BTB/POZ domain-containing protein [Parachlamydiaceae bacterium]